jgi:hypothetical protein
MLLRTPILEVPPEDPFANDALNRREFAEALTELVQSGESSFVLNLEARWGQGKTTFLRMWLPYLRARGVPCLYFNAWETDYSAEPLVSLIGELSASMDELGGESKDKASLQKQLNIVKKIGAKVLRQAVPAAVKLATAGILDLSDVTEETISDFTEKVAEEQLKHYEQGKSSLAVFRAQLESLVTSLKDKSPVLVLVIDELDRCRPDYAIRTLEAVKHIFSVPGIVFVVATDTGQLANSVRHTYGLAAAAEDYLRRFFDFSLSLPIGDDAEFIGHQLERLGINERLKSRTHQELRYDKDHIKAAFLGLFQSTQCTLRDQERCFSLLAMAMRVTAENHYLHPLLLCTLIVLRVKNPGLYADFVARRAKAGDVISYFTATVPGRAFFTSERNYSDVIEAYLAVAGKSPHSDSDPIKDYQTIADDDRAVGAVRERAANIVGLLKHFSYRNIWGSLDGAAKKLDLVEPRSQQDDR